MKARTLAEAIAITSAAAALVAGCGDEVTTTETSSTTSASSTTTSGSGGGGTGGDSASSSSGDTSATVTSSGSGGAGGGTGAGGSTGAGGAPPCPGLGDACTDCMATQCAPEYCGCYGNAECGALIACAEACGMNDPQCKQDCLTAHESGIADTFLAADCAVTTCMASCPNANSDPLNPCPKCLYQECETEMNACVSNPDCTALIQCVQMCGGNPMCPQQCGQQYPGGVSDVQAVNMCAQANCSAICN